MDFRDMSFVHIRTKDGWEELPYSECRNLLSPFIDRMSDPSNHIHYIDMPDVSSSSIRHILSIFHRQFSTTFNKEDVKDIQDTARMLGVSSGLSDLVAKKYQCLEEDRLMKDLFFITCEKDLRSFSNKKIKPRQENSNLLDEETEIDNFDEHKKELMEYKLEPFEEDIENTEGDDCSQKSPRKYIKGGSEEHKKMKERLESKQTMRMMVLAEPWRVRLFDKDGGGQKQMELRQFPGLIFDDQRTKFNICVECCEVFFVRTLPKIMKHECKLKTEVLKDKDIEVIETRSKFQNINYLKQYYTEVSVDKIRCNECSCDLKKIAELKEHLRKEHKINPSNHMCPECGNRYASGMMVRQHQVEKHERTDLAEFSCELCERIFVEKCLLTTHRKLFHTNEKPHICDVCAQSFKRKAHLDRHKIIHTGERNYPCRHCEMSFSIEWTRTQHERRHLGIKPYKCVECAKEFGQKTSLDSHNKVHHSN
eukprot:GFUD01007766.1.p1 GENE.GFUD01007766.1~~GFUD01007766.1.p1  ORF type:complete len:479 (-),score=121.78 GFUD01007766.1:124-1560(-)